MASQAVSRGSTGRTRKSPPEASLLRLALAHPVTTHSIVEAELRRSLDDVTPCLQSQYEASGYLVG